MGNDADLLIYCTSGHPAQAMGWVVSEENDKHEMNLLCTVCNRTCTLCISSRNKVTFHKLDNTH